MQKILIASNYDSPNTYVKSIADGLKQHADLVCDTDAFWNSGEHFDIVHIQWTEELFGWKLPSPDEFSKLKQRIGHWKESGAKIVLTRHNEYPHDGGENGKSVYDWMFFNADGIVHLGQYSADKLASAQAVNAVIEHPNYLELTSEIAKTDARKHLHFAATGTIFLSFGVIRSALEEQQLIDAFQSWRPTDSALYITNSRLLRKRPDFKRSPLAALRHKLKIGKIAKSGIVLLSGRVDNADLKYFFNAADVIISPRADSLNSGVVYMGFSFGKVVIGPNCGNIGGLLSKTGNPIFEPGNTESVKSAMQNAKALIDSELPNKNLEYAATACDPETVAAGHAALYAQLIAKR